MDLPLHIPPLANLPPHSLHLLRRIALQITTHLSFTLESVENVIHHDPQEILWLEVRVPVPNAPLETAQWHRKLEALELLFGLHQTFPELAIELLKGIGCPTLQVVVGNAHKYRIGFEVLIENVYGMRLRWIRQLAQPIFGQRPSSIRANGASSAFAELRDAMHKLHFAHCHRPLDGVEVPLVFHIDVSPEMSDYKEIPMAYVSIIQDCRDVALVQRRTRQDPTQAATRSPFRIHSFKFVNFGFPDHTEMLQLTTDIVKSGIDIDGLDFGVPSELSNATPATGLVGIKTVHAAASTLLRTPTADVQETHSIDSRTHSLAGVKHLRLYNQGSLQDFMVMCSTIANSQALNSVTLVNTTHGIMDPVGRRLMLSWLAYALLSDEATNRIDTLRIEGMNVLSMDDVATMKRALEAPNIYELLTTRYRAVTVRPGALGRFNAMNGGASINPDVVLHVLVDDPTSTDLVVLFPGHGLRWIDRADTVAASRDTLSARHRPQRLHRITSFEFDLPSFSFRAASDFVQIIGDDLTWLSIKCADHPTQRDEFLALLACCPQVEKLSIDTDCGFQTRWIAEAYGQGILRATCLDLAFINSGESAIDLLESLTDPGHPISSCLDDLMLQFVEEDSETYDADLNSAFVALATMLRRNTYLRGCWVWAFGEVVEVYDAVLAALDHQPLQRPRVAPSLFHAVQRRGVDLKVIPAVVDGAHGTRRRVMLFDIDPTLPRILDTTLAAVMLDPQWLRM